MVSFKLQEKKQYIQLKLAININVSISKAFQDNIIYIHPLYSSFSVAFLFKSQAEAHAVNKQGSRSLVTLS